MQADVSDELVIRGRHVGDDHESVFVPSADTLVEHHPRSQQAS
jgi:hypothetical protein